MDQNHTDTSKINFKAILLGVLSGPVAFMISLSIVGLILFAVRGHGMDKTFTHSDAGLAYVGLIMSVAYIISGYVTGSIAKNDVRANSVFVGILNTIIGVWFVYSPSYLWAISMPVITAVPLTMWGQHIQRKSIGAAYYTTDQVGMAALLGGPLAGCWLMARNYQLFGEGDKAQRAIIYGTISLAILSAAINLIGMPQSFPKESLAIMFPLALRSLAEIHQKQKLSQVIAAGTEKRSYWRMAGIGLVSCVPTVLIFLAVGFMFTFFHLPQRILYSPHKSMAEVALEEQVALFNRAQKGDAEAQFNVGEKFAFDRTFPQNYKIAAMWLQKSANQGYGKAQADLCNIYINGPLVIQDWQEAYFWCSLAPDAAAVSVSYLRQQAKEKLTPEQNAAVQKRLQEWKPVVTSP